MGKPNPQTMRQFFFLFLLFLVYSTYSQTEDPRNTTFGFRLGINSSTLSIEPHMNTNNNDFGAGKYGTTTLYGSFFSNFKITPKLSLQPELGLTYSDDLFFVEVPLFLNYDFSNKFTGFIGPKYSYLTNANYNNALFSTRSSFALDLGLRYNITPKWFLDASYSLHLTSQKQTYFTPFNTIEYYRSEFRIGIGYRF